MATGTGHWPGRGCRALEGQCLAIPHTLVIILILTTTYFLKLHLNHPGQRRVTQASTKYMRIKQVVKSDFSKLASFKRTA